MSFSTWPGYLPGHRWMKEAISPDDNAEHSPLGRPGVASGQQWTRTLGVLEAKFDKATQTDGQSDTFVRVAVSIDEPASDAVDLAEIQAIFLSRLLLAWTSLRAKHPLLACSVRDAPADGPAAIPLIQTRQFVLAPPRDAIEALRRAARTFLVHTAEEQSPVSQATDTVQDRYVLNGPRVLLAQDDCLARLVIVRSASHPLKLGFVLVISHVVSDGLSVFKLVNELFALTSSSKLPSPPSLAPFLSLSSFIQGDCDPPPGRVAIPLSLAAAWGVMLHEADLPRHLPLANEEHYPPLPLSRSAAPASASIQPTEIPPKLAALPPAQAASVSVAQQRWLWAITRAVIRVRQQRFPRTLYFPRKMAPTPPIQAKTRWPQLRFDRETSQRLIRFSKNNGVSPSMLLYSLVSLSVARVFARVHRHESYHPVVLGFPFSARPFLQHSPSRGPSDIECSDPATDCGIRITFGCIAMPSIALDVADPAQTEHVRAAVLRGARIAKAQFVRMLAPEHKPRTLFLAGMYSMILDRLLNGTGSNPIPLNEPKTALNASMIGDVDRLLPTTYALPFFGDGVTLRLSDIAIGTRLHRNEGMLLEAFTWDGQVTLCLGVDDGLIDARLVDELLDGIEQLGHAVVRPAELAQTSSGRSNCDTEMR